MRERFSNDVFFAAHHGPARAWAVAEEAFYAGRPRPDAEVNFIARAAATPMRFALLVFALGWGGILFQAGFFQQVVFGAPVFEELAKVGLALVIASLLRIRTLWITLPLAWASGAGFGVMEHHLSYATEDIVTYGGRVAFHAGSTGLSMLFYHVFRETADVRARWAATIPSTLFHWANNFAALVLGLVSILAPWVDVVAEGWSAGITVAVWLSTFAAIIAQTRFRALATKTLEKAMPRLGVQRGSASNMDPATK
jgi:hypothetical protein